MHRRSVPFHGGAHWIGAGLMSGSSCDGLDIGIFSLAAQDGPPRISTVHFETMAYPEPLRGQLRGLDIHWRGSDRLRRLERDWTRWVAQTCREVFATHGPAPHFVASHGHTAYHLDGRGAMPTRSRQIGDGAMLARCLQIPVIDDFRSADIEHGGSGAPLAPYVDWLLLRDRDRPVVCLNLGGIANVTLMPASASRLQVSGGDTGPANVLVDACVRRLTGGRQSFDCGGRWAASGRVHDGLLEWCLSRLPGKRGRWMSFAREYFVGGFLDGIFAIRDERKIPDADLLATMVAFSVRTIADAVTPWLAHQQGGARLIVSGGGVHNGAMMHALRRALRHVDVHDSKRYGLDPDAKESLIFCVLGLERMRNRSASMPHITGASAHCLLGRISMPHDHGDP